MNLSPQTLKIRELNDALRKGLTLLNRPGRLVITSGVQALPAPDRWQLMVDVRDFVAFTPDNDPHGEHDFGAVELQGTRYFWKIDYYDRALQMHSPDVADPAATSRVLTIMRADEY